MSISDLNDAEFLFWQCAIAGAVLFVIYLYLRNFG